MFNSNGRLMFGYPSNDEHTAELYAEAFSMEPVLSGRHRRCYTAAIYHENKLCNVKNSCDKAVYYDDLVETLKYNLA